MKSKRVISITLVALLVLFAALYLWWPASVPVGQEPLLTLSQTNFETFEKSFDSHTDAPRLVLLLSPT